MSNLQTQRDQAYAQIRQLWDDSQLTLSQLHALSNDTQQSLYELLHAMTIRLPVEHRGAWAYWVLSCLDPIDMPTLVPGETTLNVLDWGLTRADLECYARGRQDRDSGRLTGFGWVC